MISRHSNINTDNRVILGLINDEKPTVNNIGESSIIERTIFFNAKEIAGINDTTVFIDCIFFDDGYVPDDAHLIACKVLPASEKSKLSFLL
ncbi:hypothetical protein VCSRO2_2132 [Vibrio cholerae]|nr:hypothetical protein [Vibrio cholerae]GHW98464.1 hypothetical protein VCSRO2_2132 [Vibrio cholerae]